MKLTIRNVLTIISLSLLAACAGTATQSTVFPYEIDAALLDNPKQYRYAIASINLGNPSPSYLKSGGVKVDNIAIAYLKENGYSVIDSKIFKRVWEKSLDQYGQYYNPRNGEFKQDVFNRALVDTMAVLKADHGVDALIFTDIIVNEVSFSASSNHIARWHGISRRPIIKGPGVTIGFNWSKPMKVTSVWINIVDTHGGNMFSSIGGLDLMEEIETKLEPNRFERRRLPFNRTSLLEEGVEIAFHPFIKMKSYPGDK